MNRLETEFEIVSEPERQVAALYRAAAFRRSMAARLAEAAALIQAGLLDEATALIGAIRQEEQTELSLEWGK